MLPTTPIHAIDPEPEETRWLVRHLWGAAAVGIIGGTPKCCKSWLGLELAVSVASGTACLGRFEVDNPGRALVYLAEDALPRVRERVAHICDSRGLSLPDLDLHVVTAPSVRLDLTRDQQALDSALSTLQPRLLVLDPLVRLHRLDENSAADVSGLLGFLRELNRRHQLAIVVVHHMAKRARRDLGQALRGSSDLHAWTDSACYLVRRSDQRLRLTAEHRAAPAPEPLLLRLTGSDGDGDPFSLSIDSDDPDDDPSLPLAEAVRAALQRATRPLSRKQLRQQLRVNNARLGATLQSLQRRNLAVRTPQGWSLPATPTPPTSASQLDLLD